MDATIPPRTTAPARGRTPVRRPVPAPRPVPEISEGHAHLSLLELRAYRDVLQAEEDRVSYWRRVLQARLDVLRAGGRGGLDPARLAPVLTDSRMGAGRHVLVQALPDDDVPPLPSLEALWSRPVDLDDAEERAGLEADLAEAEGQLSAYRTALHERAGAATSELIARYRLSPDLCLTALPLQRGRR
jgi:hypothetical protein